MDSSKEEHVYSKKIIKNTAYIYISQIIISIYTIISTPLILNHILGVELYGLWTLVFTLVGYMTIFHFGINFTTIKFVAEYYAKNEFAKLKKLINTIFVMLILFGIIAFFIILFVFGSFLTTAFPHYPFLPIVNLFVAIQFTVNFIFGLYPGIFYGLQRFDLSLISTAVQVFLNFLFLFGIYFLQFGMIELVLANLITSIIVIIVNIYLIKRIIPNFEVIPRSILRSDLKKILRFNAYTFIYQITLTVLLLSDRVIIGFLFPLAYLTYYSVAYRTQEYMFSYLFKISSITFPLTSELDAKEDLEKLKELHLKATKYFSIIVFFIFVIIFFFIDSFLQIWLGPGFELSAFLTKLLCFGFAINYLGITANSYLLGSGNVKILTGVIVICAAVTFLSYFILGVYFELIGITVAVLIYYVTSSPIQIGIVNKKLGVKFKTFFKSSIILPLLNSIVIFGIAFLLTLIFPPNNLIIMAIEVILCGGIYACLLFITNTLDRFERKLIISYIPFLKKLLLRDEAEKPIS